MRNTSLLVRTAAGLLAAGASLTAQADYRSTVLTDNPSGYWRLDAWPTAKYALNLGSATGVDGVIANYTSLGQPGAIVGDANTAMYFGGLGGNTRVTIPYSWELNGNYPGFTFETWLRSDCAQGNSLGVMVNRSGESGYVLYVNGDGTLTFNVNMGTGGTIWSGVSVPAVNFSPLVGQWIHVGCVYNATNGTPYGTQYLYTNGVLAAQVDLPRPPFANPSGSLVLGDRDFAGSLDEAAVYDVPLPQSRLAAHYAAGLSGAGNYQATVLADAPKGYWRLGETGPFAIQPSSAANLGTLAARGNGVYTVGTDLQQPGALVGSANKAAYFNGSKGMYAPPGICAPNGPFSVEFWTKPNVTYTGNAVQNVPLGSMDLEFNRSGWLFYQRGDGWSWWLGDVGGTSGSYDIQLDPIVAVTTTQWYHIVGTYDGTTARMYLNGVEVTNKVGLVTNVNYSQPISVAVRASDGARFYNGSVDEVAIYTNILSAADVLAHYQNGMNASPSPSYDTLVQSHSPLAYWRLDDTAIPFMTATNLGTIASAGSGNFNGSTAVVTNDTPLVGDSNASLYFPGSSRIDIPLNEALVRTNAFSYEIWYKENTGVTGIRSPMWWRDEPSGGDTRGWVHYLQDLTGGRGHNFQSSSTATTWDGMWVVPTGLFAQAEWQHLVCTWDGLVKQIFLNGVLVQVSTNDPRYIKLVQRAACSISSGSYPFSGFLDEGAYYTNALSWQRVQAHWFAARGVNPPAVAATFRLQPQPATAYEGSAVTLKTVVLGTPPFTFQWYKDGTTPVTGQTNQSLALAPARQSDSGTYSLKVNNSGGESWSDGAYVSIEAAPAGIITGPQPASRLQGANVTFTVLASGSLPLSYQWKSNGVAISGATTSSLSLANVQPSFAANYSVLVTNLTGTAPSADAALTVVATTPGSYAATIVAAQPQAFWRLDESTGQVAYDLIGGHDGAYDFGIGLGVVGAVLGDPDTAVNFPNYAGIQVPWSAALNPANAFTIECWAKADAAGAGSSRTLVSSRNREQSSNWHFGYYAGVNTTDQWQFNTGQKTSGVDGLAGGTADTNWHHVVCTFDDSTLEKRLYVDGQLVASDLVPLNTFAPNIGFGVNLDDPPPTDEGIGTTVPADRYSGQGLYFYGDLDEVAIYNYALNPAQVAQHHAVAGPPLMNITKSGAGVSVAWNKGALWQTTDLVNGPWTQVNGATSPYAVPASGDKKFFQARLP
jgi:hypothetical protein